MIKPTVKFLGVLTLLTSLYSANTDTNITIYTENYPPYNMELDGKLQGFSTELLNAMFQKMGSKQTIDDIKLVPWARGYRIVSKKKNTMLFSTYRTSKRENLFKWVGPIAKDTDDIIALKSSKIDIKDIKDFEKYKIGAVLGWATVDLLISKGVKKENIELFSGVDATKKAFEYLLLHKIDMFAYKKNAIIYDKYLKKFNVDNYKRVYTLSSTDLYFAFNKDTDDSIIKAYQKALDSIKQTDEYKSLYKKYFK